MLYWALNIILRRKETRKKVGWVLYWNIITLIILSDDMYLLMKVIENQHLVNTEDFGDMTLFELLSHQILESLYVAIIPTNFIIP